MATVVELAQGNRYSRSSEGGGSVDTATRTFKVVRDSITESIDTPALCGIDVGDPYSDGNQVPCVGWESVPDGDSRMVLIVTFRYRSTPGGVDGSGGGGGGGGGGSDPRLRSPEARPALYQLSSTLQEVPAVGGEVLTSVGYAEVAAFKNSAGDLIEGLTRLEPIVNLQITQYSYIDQSGLLQYTGSVNSDQFVFSGHTVPAHCCIFQGLSVSPYVESGFRGFQLEFQFSFRWNYCPGVQFNGYSPLGWDQPIVESGYNIINTGLNNSFVQQEHLVYELDDDGNIASPKTLRNQGGKVRAQIPAAGVGGGERQHGAASPVLLNADGSPRARWLGALVNRAQTQPDMVFGNNFSNFGVNSFY